MKSTFLKWNLRDLIKGMIMAVLVPVFVVIQQSVAAGDLTFNLKAIGMAAIAGLLGYLTKNLFTDDIKAAEKILKDAGPQDAAKIGKLKNL